MAGKGNIPVRVVDRAISLLSGLGLVPTGRGSGIAIAAGFLVRSGLVIRGLAHQDRLAPGNVLEKHKHGHITCMEGG